MLLDVERFQVGIGKNPGIRFPPALNLDERDQLGIIQRGAANLDFHVPQSTMLLLHMIQTRVDPIRYA